MYIDVNFGQLANVYPHDKTLLKSMFLRSQEIILLNYLYEKHIKMISLKKSELNKIIRESIISNLKKMDESRLAIVNEHMEDLDDESYSRQDIVVDMDGEIEHMSPDDFYNWKKYVAKPQGLKYKVLQNRHD